MVRLGTRAGLLTLLAVAACPAPAQAGAMLPLGDGKASGDRGKGRAYMCNAPAGRPPADPLPWIEGRRWDPLQRPLVDGVGELSGARFRLRSGRSRMRFTGNGLPAGTPAGRFPPPRGDDAFSFAHTAAEILGARVTGRIDATPERRRRTSCVGASAPVAIALNGVPFLPAFDRSGRDMGARDVPDRCGGATGPAGRYWYRRLARCVARDRRGRHSPQVGWARDGFPLFGPRGQRGKRLRSRHLDSCHGHTHRVRVGGRTRRLFHYHLTPDFPYTVGCFRGKPSRSWRFVPMPAAEGSPPAGPPAGAPAPQTGAAGPEAAPEPPPPGAPEISAEPPLLRPFDVGVTDYVSRCASGEPLRLSVDSPDGTSVAVDGGPPRGGRFEAELDVSGSQRFAFTVSRGGDVSTHHVRCLPEGFPDWEVDRPGAPQAQWYIVTPTLFNTTPGRFLVIFDSHGVPVWWLRAGPFESLSDGSLLPNGNLAMANPGGGSFGDSDSTGYVERELDGDLVRTLQTVGTPTDFHDIQMTSGGNYLLLSYRRRDGVDLRPHVDDDDATVLDAEIQEISPGGDLLWSWNSAGHIALEETGHWWSKPAATATLRDGTTAWDIVHANSVEEDGDLVVLSARHNDAVYAIERDSGDIAWKLGGTATPESLAFEGDPDGAQAFGGQHDARILEDGSLALHDNASHKSYRPRMVRYAVDLGAGTATLLESISDPLVSGSFCCGGARRLPGGNWVASWGASQYVTELGPGGERQLLVRFSAHSYRANPVVPGRLSAAALREAMDAMHPR